MNQAIRDQIVTAMPRLRRRGDIVRPLAVAFAVAIATNAGQYAWNLSASSTADAVNKWWQRYVASYCVANPPTAPMLRK